MPSSPPSSAGDPSGWLHDCIRDLAALNALPSMCIGMSFDEALDVALDALPTALSSELVYLALPGAPPTERASLRGKSLDESALPEVRLATSALEDSGGWLELHPDDRLWCVAADVPMGTRRGRLVAGRATTLEPRAARILIRTAANLVATMLETATVLEAAHRKDEFLAMLGHELRNPLAPIQTAVELLARHPNVAREQQVIARHTKHLARLVDDLLDISRVTSGHVELRKEDVSLASVLERAVEMAGPLFTRQHHELRMASSENVMLHGDPVRLAQIFGNLLTNAAKFTAPGGCIEVSIERKPDRVCVSVRDNGRGIAREQLGNIFKPFVQAERNQDALRGGLGLGLAIVRNLVERHAGTVTVESDGPGCGATFNVELPTVVGAEQTVVETVSKEPTARSGVRVLIVDDNVDLAELMSVALGYEGFQTDVAFNAQTALDRWPSFVPHAAVLDVGLPELDGYELARRLRAQHGQTPTLIAATGYGGSNDRLQAEEAGFDCHFVKPVSVKDLARALDERVVHPENRDRGVRHLP